MNILEVAMAAKMAGGGVSSWNDIPDKPEGLPYVEKVYGEILPETTIEIDPNEGGGMLEGIVPSVIGNRYTVTWNGVDYECVCVDTGVPAYAHGLLGNGVMMGGEDTGEPFAIASVPESGVTIFACFDGSTSAVLSVNGEIDIVHPIDSRCLPGGDAGSFDLTALGLGEVVAGGEEMTIACDTTAIRAAMGIGTVKFTVNMDRVKEKPGATSWYNGVFTVPVNGVAHADGFIACTPITPCCQFFIDVNPNTGISVRLTLDE